MTHNKSHTLTWLVLLPSQMKPELLPGVCPAQLAPPWTGNVHLGQSDPPLVPVLTDGGESCVHSWSLLTPHSTPSSDQHRDMQPAGSSVLTVGNWPDITQGELTWENIAGFSG